MLQPHSAQDGCRLLLLPPELRNRIYELVLIDQDDRIQALFGDDYDSKETAADLSQPALTRVSRAVRKDTLPIFYGQHTFYLWLDHSGAKRTYTKWMTAIEARVRLFRLVKLVMCHNHHALFFAVRTGADGRVQCRLETENGESPPRSRDWTSMWGCSIVEELEDHGVNNKIRALEMISGVDGFGAEEYIQIAHWFQVP